MNKQREQQKQVEHCIVIFLLDAKYVQWVHYISRILLCQIILWLVPHIEVELEYVLHDDQHLLTENKNTNT